MNKLFAKSSFLLAGLGMLLTSGALKGSLSEMLDPFVDPIQYEKPVAEAYEVPVEKEESRATDVNDIKKVIINYYNEDKKNNTRDIYTWVNGGADELYNKLILDDDEYAHIVLDFEGNASNYAGSEFIKFIVKYRDTWTGQSLDTILNLTEFEVDESGVLQVWTCPGDAGSVEIYATKAETQMEKVRKADFVNWKKIHCSADVTPKEYRLYAYDKAYLASTDAVQRRTQYLRLLKRGVPTSKEFDITFNYTAHINVQYVVETEYNEHAKIQRKIVSAYKLYEDTNFNKYYTYSGNDLGLTLKDGEATFKVWAPTAGGIVLNIYNVGTPKGIVSVGGGSPGSNIHKSYFMTMQPGGVWEKTLTFDDNNPLEGKYYTYTVYNSEGVNEVCDPYAKTTGVNGIRGMILDFSKTNPEHWDDLPAKWDGVTGYDIKTPQELSIYEIHIRDLTEDESWNGTAKGGSFQAFYEKGTRLASNSNVKTGFDHIEELGVNAIQIVPVYDQDNSEFYYYYKDNDPNNPRNYVTRTYEGAYKDNLHLDYNWGYNPLNYNVVEGAYCSNPEDGAVRVQEFKQLVYNYGTNANHTRVIMDVVYNHVSSVANCNFTKLMPRYYFRFNEAKDEYYNGSDCSNEVKSEAKMMSKFIVDSLCWWASEYKIKGFRFDLMGLIDTDTLNAARKELYKIDPDIYIYGEGWKSISESGLPESKGGFTKNVYNNCKAAAGSVILGCFNDAGRDSIRGGNDGGWGSGLRTPGWGFMSQGASDVKDKADHVRNMLLGYNSWQANYGNQDTRQTVNYAACHDNYTLYDQFSWTLSDTGGSATSTSAAPAVKYVMQAATACNVAVMLSTGAAFMLGGDELFRTKEEDHPELSRLDEDFVKMYGKNISHNSYKSSTHTNAFDWNRKVSVTGYKEGDSEPTAAYFEALKAAIAARKDIAKKGTWARNCDNNSSTTKVNYFVQGNTAGYKMYLSGRGGTAACDWWAGTSEVQYIKVGNYTYGTASGGNRPVNIQNYSVLVTKV